MPVVKIDGAGTFDVKATPGTPEFDSAVDEIKAKHSKEPKTMSEGIAGTSAGIGRGLVQGVVDLPFQGAKIGLAQARVHPVNLLLGKVIPGWSPVQNTAAYLDQIQEGIDKKIQSVGPRGWSTNLGPVELSGEALGGLVSGVAIPGAVFGKAAEGAGFAGRMWGAVKTGAKFGAATSVPNVALARDMEEAQDRLIQAGANITVGGLLAGALHGGGEAVAKLLSYSKPKGPVIPVKGGPGAPPLPPEDRWNDIGEYIHDRMRGGSGGTGVPVEPHLDIKPGLEDTPKAEAPSRPKTPAEAVKQEAEDLKAQRAQRKAENAEFWELGNQYANTFKKYQELSIQDAQQSKVLKLFREVRKQAEKILSRAGIEKPGEADYKNLYDLIEETRKENGPTRRFHGSPEVVTPDEISHVASDFNLYGPGFYTTTEPHIANSYAEKNFTPGTVHEAREKVPVKAFNLETTDWKSDEVKLTEEFLRTRTKDPLAQNVAQQFEKDIRGIGLSFEREEPFRLSEFFTELQRQYAENDGTWGAEAGFKRYTDLMVEFQNFLKEHGYGAFDHTGGRISGATPHDVRIYWDPPNQIEVQPIHSKGDKYDFMMERAVSKTNDYNLLLDAIEKRLKRVTEYHETGVQISAPVSASEMTLLTKKEVTALVHMEKDNRRWLAEKLKEQRAMASELNRMNARLEAITEHIAMRGHPVGELWGTKKEINAAKDLGDTELRREMATRIAKKLEALKNADPIGVQKALEPPQQFDLVREYTQNVREAGKLPKGPLPKDFEDAKNAVLAEKASLVKRNFEAFSSTMKGAVEAFQNSYDPMGKASPETQKAFDIVGQSELLETVAIPQLEQAMQKSFTLQERQLVSIMNDPVGRELLSGEGNSITPAGSMMLDSTRVFLNKYHDFGVRKGVISFEAFVQDFVPRVYDLRTAPKVIEFWKKSGAFQGENPHSLERMFQNIWDAHKAGFRMKSLDVGVTIPEYVRSINRTVTHNELVDQLKKVAPENYQWFAEDEPKHGWMKAPEGLLGNMIVENGVAKHLYINPKDGRLIKNMIDASKPGNSLMKWNAWNKKVTLAFDVYHYWQMQRAYAAANHTLRPFGKWREGKRMLEPDHEMFPLVRELIVEHKLAPGGTETKKIEFDKFLEKLSSKDPSVAKLLHLAGKPVDAFSKHLWENVVPGFTVRTAVESAQRMLKDPDFAHLDRGQILDAAAKVANEAFGQKNWRTLGQSRALTEASRLLIFAPQWLETRFRLIGGGLKAIAEIEAANMNPYSKGLRMTPTSPEGKAYARYWTGYIGLGMLTSYVMNSVIQAMYPETKKFPSTQGTFDKLTKITFPSIDRHGLPLVMSPFPGLEYALELAHDWRRFYANRSSAAMRLLYHLRSGLDYKGAKDAPAAWSFETFLHVVGDIIPLPMFYASGERVVSSETPEHEAEKALFRSLLLGLHNSPQYPTELLNTQDYLRNRAGELNKQVNGTKNPILKTILGWQVARHNKQVDEWADAVTSTFGAEKIAGTIQKNKNQLYVGKPK